LTEPVFASPAHQCCQHPSTRTLVPPLIPAVAPSRSTQAPIRWPCPEPLPSPLPTTATPSPAPAAPSPNDTAPAMPLPPHAGAAQSTAGPVPPMGLVIPNIPVTHPNGTKTPKSEAWRDVVRHWTVGEPRLNLFVPLKDWPHHYYNGRYGWQHNTKYYQRSIIALEFLNEYVRPFFLSPPLPLESLAHSSFPDSKGMRKTSTRPTAARSLGDTRV